MGCAGNPLFLGGTWAAAAASNRTLTAPPPLRSTFQATPLRFLLNPLPLLRTNIPRLSLSPFHFPPDHIVAGNNNNNNNGNNNNGNGNDGNNGNPFEGGGEGSSGSGFLLLLLLSVSAVLFVIASAAVARTLSREGALSVWEVRGLSRWTRLLVDPSKDEFVPAPDQHFRLPTSVGKLWSQCRGLLSLLLLPEGFPHSVTPDYLDYCLWRGVQGVASQISEVLATQALLYAVGLGKGAIPAAAAMNWVLKDGIGYLSKIMLSKYGRHFDVNPKGWRLFADLLENAAFGLEMLTPAFPNLFVGIGAIAGASRSAAALIQASTRSCFYAGFAAQRNFAEVIAKGEAQGMVSKFIGIMLGIALANCIGSSTPLALASFSVVTWIHMFCNLKSYQCIQLRTLNPYRASNISHLFSSFECAGVAIYCFDAICIAVILNRFMQWDYIKTNCSSFTGLVFSEYLLSGQAPPIRDVNDEEPFFPAISFLRVSDDKEQSVALTPEASVAAAEIDQRLQLGSKLSAVVRSKEEVVALFNLYGEEGYFLTEHGEKFCVVLKEGCSAQDLLKSVFQANYLYWLERNAGIEARSICDDCRPGGRLHISLDYARREFNHVRNDSSSVGWVTDGLIARPLPTRIQLGEVSSSIAR